MTSMSLENLKTALDESEAVKMFLEVLTMDESEQKIVLVQGICKKISPIGRPSRSNLQMYFSKGGVLNFKKFSVINFAWETKALRLSGTDKLLRNVNDWILPSLVYFSYLGDSNQNTGKFSSHKNFPPRASLDKTGSWFHTTTRRNFQFVISETSAPILHTINYEKNRLKINHDFFRLQQITEHYLHEFSSRICWSRK